MAVKSFITLVPGLDSTVGLTAEDDLDGEDVGEVVWTFAEVNVVKTSSSPSPMLWNNRLECLSVKSILI
jgi:hypothetical protein